MHQHEYRLVSTNGQFKTTRCRICGKEKHYEKRQIKQLFCKTKTKWTGVGYDI